MRVVTVQRTPLVRVWHEIAENLQDYAKLRGYRDVVELAAREPDVMLADIQRNYGESRKRLAAVGIVQDDEGQVL